MTIHTPSYIRTPGNKVVDSQTGLSGIVVGVGGPNSNQHITIKTSDGKTHNVNPSTTKPANIEAPNNAKRETLKMTTKNDVYAVVTDQIIAALEAGTIPWHKPWVGARNLISGKDYRGFNTMVLGSSKFSSPYWVTYKQAQELGGTVRKGEKSTPVVFWKWSIPGKKNEDSGEIEAIPGEKSRCFPFYHRVFNIEQCDGIPEDKIPVLPETDGTIENCELIVDGYDGKPPIEHHGASAFYSPIEDKVTMPGKNSFDNVEAYYLTLFRELGHSTGHGKRLGRLNGVTVLAKFGSPDYSKEELVAELTSAMLGCAAGIQTEQHVENSAAYIASWLKVLKNNRTMVVEAAQQAQKAADHILGEGFVPCETAPKTASVDGSTKTVLPDLSLPQLPHRVPTDGIPHLVFSGMAERQEYLERTGQQIHFARPLWSCPDGSRFADYGDYRRHIARERETEWKDRNDRWVSAKYMGSVATIQLPSLCGGAGPLPWSLTTSILEHGDLPQVRSQMDGLLPDGMEAKHIRLQNELTAMGWTRERRLNVGSAEWKIEDHTVAVVRNGDATKARRKMTKAELAVSDPSESSDDFIEAVKTVGRKLYGSPSVDLDIAVKHAKTAARPTVKATAKRGTLTKGGIKWHPQAELKHQQAAIELNEFCLRKRCPVCGAVHQGDGDTCEYCKDVVGTQTVNEYQTALMGEF